MAVKPLSLGEACRNARHRAGMTIQRLSEISGIGEDVIGRLENDKNQTISFYTIVALATALRLKVDDYAGHHAMPENRTTLRDLPLYTRMGINMKARRILADMTVRDLADVAGVSVTTLRNAENGHPGTQYTTVELCADALGLSVEEYTGGSV